MAMQFTVIGRLAKDPEFKSVNDVKVLKLLGRMTHQFDSLDG